RVEIQSDKKTVNGKSVLSVLGAGIKCGDTITIVCDGAGEETALEKLTLLLKSN
ncbi:MAG: HPr component phosphorylation site, partial [Clostridiales bacterium]|nr:HPr component phosphorylation site [Clostridiales bacterium]